MSKKGETNLHYVPMFLFSESVLLMSMGERNIMCDAYALKNRMEFLVFTTPIRLHGKNFAIKEAFNMLLKKVELLKHIKFFS